MKLQWPDGYHVEKLPERKRITVNGRDFTCSEWVQAVTPKENESAITHAHRLATALGVGCVTTNR